ncbi:MAG: HAMP domain-containing histidine kinase [Anaerolineae bacterium]|nr:HAMP domain-containing histidine kinase [Anaerolineae bacterium]MDW8173268.1 HAMP domain-containing sensor histidine kinase [Anaerolineae bacterium]
MSPHNSPLSSESVSIARELLRLIAQKPSLDAIAPTILQWIQHILLAEAAFLTVFEEPHVFHGLGIAEDAYVLGDDWWQKTLARMIAAEPVQEATPAPYNVLYPLWISLPLVVKGRSVGCLCLFYSKPIVLDAAQREWLVIVTDALLILTESAKTSARHEKLMRNQAEFVRILSHDLRTPLTSILGFASMLESGTMGDLNEKQRYFIEKIISGVAQMTSLVDNIQDAGRYDPETGFYQMERAPLDLNELAERIVQNQLVPAEKMDLELVFVPDPDVPIINADQRMLERSIINLVDNAIKYTPNGGKIEVRVSHTDEDVTITVRDNGLGISAENMRQLFQRHFRIRRPEHKKVKGSGLGLFIVRSVARQHDGEAFVESVEGQGSTFGLRLPLSGANLLGGDL